jgi:hypothetical protein
MSGVSHPSYGARRSRRGYHYQDLYTLLCCLEMLHGTWDEVLPEGEEDVTCHRVSPPARQQVQVKTVENPTALWTPARLCRPDTQGQPETSILGRLFTNKELPDETTLMLLVNEGVNRDLLPLRIGQSLDRSAIELQLTNMLDGVNPSSNRTVRWCVARLHIEELEATEQGLEDRVFRLLGRTCLAIEYALLPDELDELLLTLVQHVQAAARAVTPTSIERAAFEVLLRHKAEEMMRATNEAQGYLAPTLNQKLRTASLNDEQIRRCQQMRAGFNRRRRSAIGQTAAMLDHLSDEVFMACSTLTAERNAGQIAPGPDLYAQTVRHVRDIYSSGGWTSHVALGEAYGALHEITARCQHRYD